jgi:hypothetical protein
MIAEAAAGQFEEDGFAPALRPPVVPIEDAMRLHDYALAFPPDHALAFPPGATTPSGAPPADRSRRAGWIRRFPRAELGKKKQQFQSGEQNLRYIDISIA